MEVSSEHRRPLSGVLALTPLTPYPMEQNQLPTINFVLYSFIQQMDTDVRSLYVSWCKQIPIGLPTY